MPSHLFGFSPISAVFVVCSVHGLSLFTVASKSVMLVVLVTVTSTNRYRCFSSHTAVLAKILGSVYSHHSFEITVFVRSCCLVH